jgi:hypothetical protein
MCQMISFNINYIILHSVENILFFRLVLKDCIIKQLGFFPDCVQPNLQLVQFYFLFACSICHRINQRVTDLTDSCLNVKPVELLDFQLGKCFPTLLLLEPEISLFLCS